ncbi:MAG: MoaD/ThiS family protein [Planctomycetes bacterium]|nr:MoaD/ThiS family protein [Planctomycetota bacterium]
MVRVFIAPNLRRLVPALPREVEVEARTARKLIAELERGYPGLSAHLLDDQGALRQHVNLFVNAERIADRAALADALPPGATVDIIQALSGG